MNRLIAVALTVSLPCIHADPLRPVLDAVRDVYTPVSTDEQRLAGLLALRIRANTEGYLEHVKVAELLDAFGEQPAPEQASAGQAAGLFLEAAANTYEYTGDKQVKAVMNRVAQGLVALQKPDGHLGAFAPNGHWNQTELSAQGTALLGLLSYSRVTGDDASFAAARRLADLLVRYALSASPKGSEEWGKGDLLGSVVNLYRATGDPRYYDFCKRLIQAASTNTAPPANAVEQRDLLLYWAGLVDYFRLSGDQTALTPALEGWKRTKQQGLGITGSPIEAGVKDTSRDMVTDACLTATWMRLTFELLQLRGESQYADELERTIYNQLLASQDPRTGRIDPCTDPGGVKKPALKADTCTAAESLGLSTLPQTVWGRHNEGIAINFYQPGHATIRLRRRATVQLYSEADYPDSGDIRLHLETTHDVHFPLLLRVPEWTDKFTARIGSSVLTGKPGQYLVLNREWKRGDTIQISMDMTSRTISNPENPSEIALQRGPQFLVPANSNAAPALNSRKLKLIEGRQPGEYMLAGEKLILVPYSESSSYRLWMKFVTDTQ